MSGTCSRREVPPDSLSLWTDQINIEMFAQFLPLKLSYNLIIIIQRRVVLLTMLMLTMGNE